MVTVWYVDEEDASFTDHVSVLVEDHGCDILDDYLRATPAARNIKILCHRVDGRGTRFDVLFGPMFGADSSSPRILSCATLDNIISDFPSQCSRSC